MTDLKVNSKNQNLVKILGWVLIIGSLLFLVKILLVNDGYSGIINKYFMTKNFDPPLEYSFTSFVIFAVIEILLCITVFISAANILKYKDIWRRLLIYSLGLSIIVMFLSPKIIIIPYLWYILFAIFSIIVIVYLSKKEVKLLFK